MRLTPVAAPADQRFTTTAYGCGCMKETFTLQSDHGVGLDWPLSYADLAPHYDRVQTEVGLSGDADQERWRPQGAPYPMPPLPLFAQSRVLARV